MPQASNEERLLNAMARLRQEGVKCSSRPGRKNPTGIRRVFAAVTLRSLVVPRVSWVGRAWVPYLMANQQPGSLALQLPCPALGTCPRCLRLDGT